MKSRILISFLVVGVLTLASWYIYSRIQRSRREAKYAQTLAIFQRDLHTGMTREEVDRYLSAKKIAYDAAMWGGNRTWTYQINVGKDPGDGFVCGSWSVYVALEFSSGTQSALTDMELAPVGTDRLSQVHLRKVGKCL